MGLASDPTHPPPPAKSAPVISIVEDQAKYLRSLKLVTKKYWMES